MQFESLIMRSSTCLTLCLGFLRNYLQRSNNSNPIHTVRIIVTISIHLSQPDKKTTTTTMVTTECFIPNIFQLHTLSIPTQYRSHGPSNERQPRPVHYTFSLQYRARHACDHRVWCWWCITIKSTAILDLSERTANNTRYTMRTTSRRDAFLVRETY